MFDLFNHLHNFLCFTKILRIYEREFFYVKIFKCVVIEKVYTKFVDLFKVIMENGNICIVLLRGTTSENGKWLSYYQYTSKIGGHI